MVKKTPKQETIKQLEYQRGNNCQSKWNLKKSKQKLNFHIINSRIYAKINRNINLRII